MNDTEPPRITKIEREKNPKRVEQGKRLAAISRSAKEKKAREREAAEKTNQTDQREDSGGEFSLNTTTIAIIGPLWLPGVSITLAGNPNPTRMRKGMTVHKAKVHRNHGNQRKSERLQHRTPNRTRNSIVLTMIISDGNDM